MKTILILLIFIASPVFSQKLWEIEVNPNDLLRDVSEIPNSDLLLFTYNSGKLEIRNSNDGSLVRNVIRPQGEKGGYNISGLGNSYYFSARGDYEPDKEETYVNDTIFVFDLFTDEIINRITFDVGQYKSQSNFITKTLKYNFTPDMTKVFGQIGYNFIDGPGFHFFYVYDINQRKIIYTEEVNRLRVSEEGEFTGPGFYLKSYRSSPDSKYLILNGMDNGDGKWDEPVGAAKMFNVELNEMGNMLYISTLGEYEYSALINNEFINNELLGIYDIYEIKLYNFPELTLKAKYNFQIKDLKLAGFHFCENYIILNCFQRKPNAGKHEYEYWYSIYNIDTESITYNSYDHIKFPPGVKMVLINDCNSVVFINDVDYTRGKIVCYDFQTLSIENLSSTSDFFNKTENTITFNSQEFIGQIANIEIYNSVGARVGTLYNGSIHQPNYNFNIPDLPSGAYYLQCQLPNQSINFNFVVVK